MAKKTDIFKLIEQDHRKVADLFKKLEGTKDTTETRDTLFAELKTELEIHTHAEGEVFYDALQEAEMTADMVEDAVEEHRLVAELLEELEMAPKDGAAWHEQLQVLKENVEAHVEEEETEMFEGARQLWSAEQLEELGERWEMVKQEYIARR